MTQEIDVLAAGQLLTTWQFSVERNRAKHGVTIPAAAVVTDEWGFPKINLEFRPRSVAPIIELDPSRDDRRELGLALFRIRRGPPE